jgi:PAS domain S-box-containing protein
MDTLPIGFIYMMEDTSIVFTNDFLAKILHRQKEDLINERWNDLFPGLIDGLIENLPSPKIFNFQYGQVDFIAQRFPYRDDGFMLIIQMESELEKVSKGFNAYKELDMDIKAIFDISYDVLFVADAHGNTIRVSSACKELWGYEEKDLLGKSVYQLEKEGVFNPSITRLVLEQGKKVSSVQTTKTGKRLMVIGTPIKEEGKIIRVVNASRDITEVSQLQKELDELKQVTEGYKKELLELREKTEEVQQVIYRSEKMRHILSLARKLGDVDSTVLIEGESGVGKEIISAYIHKSSYRKANPFITINCGAMPKDILEVELFGMERGRYEDGKLGLFELANEGTLFLDEISELPLDVQSKLLRVLSEKQILRLGGTKVVEVNVRIIASTNRNLVQKVKEGRLREELYYRLNVIPITIPPLRERKEDILPLTLHFIKQLNQKYKMSKQLSSTVMDQLSIYNWPGNVRELQNIIERVLITSDSPIIGLEQLPEHIKLEKHSESAVQISKIIPLKDAVDLVEKKLLQMAQSKYGSTTKMAEILQVNQSTISRKLKKK